MSTIRSTIANTNDTGAGSLRQALSDVSAGTPYRMTFGASGTVALGSILYFSKTRGYISGGSQRVIIASNYSPGTSYSSVVSADALSLDHLAFDNTMSGGDGASLLIGDDNAPLHSSTFFMGRHLYVRSLNDDALGVVGRHRRMVFEYCVFDGTYDTGHSAALLSSVTPDGANPKTIELTFKHCLFIGSQRIPDITFGTVNLLGNVIVRRTGAGRLWAGARVNLVNNYMIDPSDYGAGYWPGSPLQLLESTTFNGDALAASSIYSAGNLRNGTQESQWADNMYTLVNTSTVAPATYFRSTPWPTIHSLKVPPPEVSRELTLCYAGCYRNRSTNDAQAIAKAIYRRPAGAPF